MVLIFITKTEFDMFKRIKLQEISWQAWSKNGGVDSPNVTAMIDRFNKVFSLSPSPAFCIELIICRWAFGLLRK